MNKISAVAEMGDRLATIDMGRKVGAVRGGDFVPRRPLHWSFHGLLEPPSVTELSLLPRLQFGTAFRKQSVLQHLWPCSESH